MNQTVCSGYLQKKAEYILNGEGQREFRFFLNVYSYSYKDSYAIPFKAIGDIADKCYAEISVGDYMEITGEIVRPSPQQMYIVCRDIMYRKPKGNKEYYIKTTEFLEFFNPSKIIERAIEKNLKKR